MTDMVLDLKDEQNSEDFCKYTLHMVLKSLNSLHSQNTIHRNVQSDNMIVFPEGEIKLISTDYIVLLTES